MRVDLTDRAMAVIADTAHGAFADYQPHWLTPAEARHMLEELIEREDAFEGGNTLVDGRPVRTPRRCAAFGDDAFCYPDLGASADWPPLMRTIRDRLAGAAGHPFNYALVNWYRDGQDYTGWHADKIHLHEPGTTIAIVSLGARRRLQFRPIGERRPSAEVALEHGSLLWMRGDLQLHYEHAVPAEPAIERARFSVTFRDVLRPENA